MAIPALLAGIAELFPASAGTAISVALITLILSRWTNLETRIDALTADAPSDRLPLKISICLEE